MNRKPIEYMQTDPRWKSLPYRVPGESATIGGSGCGPTCAAMLIETLTGKTFTPVDACAWSKERGYKALNQGTYYSYFVPQFAAFGILCERLNTVNVYGKPDNDVHDEALRLLKEGYYLIACMGKGLWTSSGHYIVVWWEDGKVHINDPASTKPERLLGDLDTFRQQVKYYWAIDAREYNASNDEEDEEMAPRYNTLAEIEKAAPWALPTINKMIDKGFLSGGGKKDTKGKPADMDLSLDMIRIFVTNNAAGLYDR